MARHINNLQDQVEELTKMKNELTEMIQDFRVHLTSSKFQGEGNDYINVRDVEARLMDMWLKTA